MKRLILPVFAVIGLGAALQQQLSHTGEPAAAPAGKTGPAPDLTVMNPAEVFQRAFWKRPFPADHILHAERREWKDDGAVSRWQWFLEVEPSPEITRYLRDENAFRLKRAGTTTIPTDAPEWFTPATRGSEILSTANGSMQLVFTEGKLYALGSGAGFQPGAPEPPRSVVAADSTGRLTPNPPPPARQ